MHHHRVTHSPVVVAGTLALHWRIVRAAVTAALCIVGHSASPYAARAQSGAQTTRPAGATWLPNQRPTDPAIPRRPSSTPASGDTTGYWQQRADYRIRATLNDSTGEVRASGTLHYVNHSPDTLRELYLHQHLNAFRPASRWAAMDTRDGRQRFQSLPADAQAYERFTAPPRIHGVAIAPEYPLAPDSTVVRLVLPRPLAPHDSLDVALAWVARPSTTLRRQGRRGRSVDFAQWYPKVAVYDRDGWKPNALQPAGEFYGEFGTFDVTLQVASDQVVGATGVPVDGDPGWSRVRATSSAPPRLARHAYGAEFPPTTDGAPAETSMRAVRFVATNVHHFAWSASPGFVYEGTSYVRARSHAWRFPVWDTVSVHVLYRGDAAADCTLRVAHDAAGAGAPSAAAQRAATNDCIAVSQTQWMQGRALQQAVEALRWFEQRFGDYPYPQLTMLKRLEDGGTEFPMLVENGSASMGLAVHEIGHLYTYGVLANNEWQSGWLDEGMASYQEAWQAGEVRAQLTANAGIAQEADPSHPVASELQPLRQVRERLDTRARDQAASVQSGIAQPIGLRADRFTSFDVYADMVYDRAQAMFDALHDVLGAPAFAAFLRDYYARWQFRHVDRWAMQASAERVSNGALGWFFTQWVERTGVIDYALRSPAVTRTRAGYMVTVQLHRMGDYRHPMPVGVRTASGWTVVRADPARDRQTVSILVDQRPEAVWLDPFGSTESPTRHFYQLPLTVRRAPL